MPIEVASAAVEERGRAYPYHIFRDGGRLLLLSMLDLEAAAQLSLAPKSASSTPCMKTWHGSTQLQLSIQLYINNFSKVS